MEDDHASPPRVLVVTNKLTMGGAERHLAQTLPDLKARGLAVELFVLERGGELEAGLVAAGVPVSGPLRRLNRIAHLSVVAVSLYRHIRAMRPDVLHFFLPQPYLVGAMVAMISGHKTCFMSRRSLTHYHRNHPWSARLERLLHRRMSALLGNSQAVVDELISETGDHHKIGLIHNGVVIRKSTAEDVRLLQRAALNISNDEFVMVIVANLIPYKGHFDLLQALGAIALKLPQPWRLVVIGRDDGIGLQLKAEAERLNIADRILWLGERCDVDAILPAADTSLLVSHQEGFSNALIEAMGQGLPVIATAVGGNLDAIVDGKSGRLVPVGDSERLGVAILELALDPVERKALGRAARERAVALFSQISCVDRYQRLYRGIGRSQGAPIQAIIDGDSSIQQESAR